jgi:hypothetical protein
VKPHFFHPEANAEYAEAAQHYAKIPGEELCAACQGIVPTLTCSPPDEDSIGEIPRPTPETSAFFLLCRGPEFVIDRQFKRKLLLKPGRADCGPNGQKTIHRADD